MIQDRSRKVQNVPDLVEQFAQLLLHFSVDGILLNQRAYGCHCNRRETQQIIGPVWSNASFMSGVISSGLRITPCRTKGFGIFHKVHRPEIDPGFALVFQNFLRCNHVICSINPDKMNDVRLEPNSRF